MPLPPIGQIPQSHALAEADPGSLTELFSRDPEGYTGQDLDRIIDVLRDQRARFAKAEQEAQATGKRTARVAGPKVENLKAPASAQELDL